MHSQQNIKKQKRTAVFAAASDPIQYVPPRKKNRSNSPTFVPVMGMRLWGNRAIRRYRRTGVIREQVREKLVSLFHYGKNVINSQAFINRTQIRQALHCTLPELIWSLSAVTTLCPTVPTERSAI